MFEFFQPDVGRGRENELTGDAHQIERERPVLAAEGACRIVVLARHDFGRVAGAKGRIVLLPDGAVETAPVPLAETGVERIAHGSCSELVEPTGNLHDVGIGVVDDAVLDVWHQAP